jgi:hypothetical protein
MPAQTKEELVEQLKALDHLDPVARANAITLVSLYVNFLLHSPGMFLAGPIGSSGPSGKTTHATIDCPNCGYKISASFK